MRKGMVSLIIPTTPRELSMANISRGVFFSACGKYHIQGQVIIVNEGKERSAQRNIGLDRAEGEFILYLDSDQQVHIDLVEECLCLMLQGYDAVYIPEIITTKGWFGKLRNYERQFYTGTAVDCVRFIRRSCCPRFDESLHGPEDSLHDREVQGKKAIAQNPVYHHDNIGVIDYFKKKAYYSKSMRRFAELSPKDKCLSPLYRCIWIFFEKGKWRHIVRHPVMFLGVLCLIFVRGIIYLKNK